ncbi:uncharacterized protein LOC110812531 [Carica papaya]|uniref:uncharacterized protein LOC110812531 n=1 Tax=Carica papaya TaxID=3649 RepID=UPI000B8CED37|nr:uncharacterized protein LOC110812531 [Carica papaya]
MAQIETLGILQEIQALVSDQLKVVYSVQASIPEDPASLWNAEYVQAEELFKQPHTFDNFLRDNRFCGISNSFVKCNVEGSSTSIAAPQPKSEAIAGSSRHTFTSAVSAPQQNKVQQYSPKVGPQSLNVVKDVKNETNSKADNEQSTKASMDKEKVIPMPTNKKKSQNDNNSSGTGSSLANLWGRAAVKSKPNSAPAYDNKSITDPTGNADAQIHFLEAVDNRDSDDEDAQDVNLTRASNGEDSRKRRLVLDYSDDEYEDAVSLASPDISGQSSLGTKGNCKPLIPEKPSLVLNKEKENELKEENEPKVKEEMSTNSNQLHQDDSLVLRKSMKSDISSSEKIQNGVSANDINKEKPTEAANNSPKRRKVLKTRIDERGREGKNKKVVWVFTLISFALDYL